MKSYQQDITAVTQGLNTDLEQGISSTQAAERAQQYGPNSLPEKKAVSIFLLMFRQLYSPLMFVLVFAAAVSLMISEVSDAIVIGLAALINVVIGFVQEYRADRAAQALRSYEVAHAQVLREGAEITIPAHELVPGDIVYLEQGGRVPADVRLSYVNDFQVEEAILTGESVPVTKTTEAISQECATGDQTNIAFAGTYVIQGKAQGVVVATGQLTALGDIAQLVTQTEEEATPLQEQIKRFSWLLGGMMFIITVLIVLLGLLKGFSLYKIVTLAVALAVAAIPEGLLVAVTVVLAIGMQRMLKRKALVRHLVAAETLGSVSVICTDKTGTLTQGRMAVVTMADKDQSIEFNGEQVFPAQLDELLKAIALNNDARVSSDRKHRIGSPTEIALLECALDNKVDLKTLQDTYPRISEVPFSSDAKFMVTVHRDGDQEWLIVKGAPEKVARMCRKGFSFYESITADLTNQGLRVIAVAQKHADKIDLERGIEDLEFLGVIALQDPLRPSAKKTVQILKKAGIRVVIVTGDHSATALRIAHGAGVGEEQDSVLIGSEIDTLNDTELLEKINDVDVYARVDPRHKIRIVQAFKKLGNTVAMTGDGVNDAPALKAADIGVALGSGSDVSHEIADMVLLDNNLATIGEAVREGRVIFDNIRKVIVYLMVDSFSEIALIIFSLLAGFPLPMTAVQILWINLITDGFPDVALTMEPGEEGIMSEPPRSKEEPVVNTHMKIIIFVIGIITDIGLCAMFWVLLKGGYELSHIRTMMFTALGLDSLLYVFSVRSMRSTIFATNPFKNPWLIIAVCLGLLLQFSALYVPFLQVLLSTVPLTVQEWGIIGLLSLIKIFFIEGAKMILLRRHVK